jgi:hypothetical protein
MDSISPVLTDAEVPSEQVECCQIEYGKKHCDGDCTCHVCAPDLHERDAAFEKELE